MQSGSRCATKPMLVGVETEYAVSAEDADGLAVPKDDIHAMLCDRLRNRYCWMHDKNQSTGTYFQNGSRFYFDYGQHPEYASPECLTPRQVACHEKAGERLLHWAAAEAMAKSDVKITVLKNNVCPVQPDVTWATHESYTCWTEPDRAAAALIPHVVTRVPYAGAGNLKEKFELSQRARFITCCISDTTTTSRPLFCKRRDRRIDHLDGQWQRVHLLAKDSQRMPFGTYLTFGTTALIFLLINSGKSIGQGLQLADPVRAIKQVSADPGLRDRLTLKNGQSLTPVEIQAAYLSQCEREICDGSYPSWTREVLKHWSVTLAALGRNPRSLANRLDAYCKLAIFNRELQRTGASWDDAEEAIQRWTGIKELFAAPVCDAAIAATPRFLWPDEREQLRRVQTEVGNWQHPRRLELLRLAARLLYLDVHFHELGGLYDKLEEHGAVDMSVITDGQIKRAMRKPPRGGRAEMRGKHIREKCGQQWECDWLSVQDLPLRHSFDLLDPFQPSNRLTTYGQADGEPDLR